MSKVITDFSAISNMTTSILEYLYTEEFDENVFLTMIEEDLDQFKNCVVVKYSGKMINTYEYRITSPLSDLVKGFTYQLNRKFLIDFEGKEVVQTHNAIENFLNLLLFLDDANSLHITHDDRRYSLLKDIPVLKKNQGSFHVIFSLLVELGDFLNECSEKNLINYENSIKKHRRRFIEVINKLLYNEPLQEVILSIVIKKHYKEKNFLINGIIMEIIHDNYSEMRNKVKEMKGIPAETQKNFLEDYNRYLFLKSMDSE